MQKRHNKVLLIIRHTDMQELAEKGNAICRFNFPITLMPSTVILEPLNDDDDKKLAEKNYLKVATLMNEMNNVDVMSFSDFLKELELYILPCKYL